MEKIILNHEVNKANYKSSLENRAKSGFITERDVYCWEQEISNNRQSIFIEAERWGITVCDVKNIFIKVIKKYNIKSGKNNFIIPRTTL